MRPIAETAGVKSSDPAPPPDAVVSSFDVFDTTIIRLVYRPEDLFLAVGAELVRQTLCIDAESWARLRVTTELEVRRRVDSIEITMAQIYDALMASCGWSMEQKTLARQVELSLERALVRPLEITHDAIRSLRSAGRRCIFISDTYLSRQEVISLLGLSGMDVSSEDVFVSSEYGLTKGSGHLYREVRKAIHPLTIDEHSGDNYKSDVLSATQAGVRAKHFSASSATRYERALSGTSAAPRIVRSAIAAAARAARLAKHWGNERDDTLWATGAGVMGPLLTAYICWVLSDAKKRGIRRLYFVARDGWIMRELAVRLNPLLRHDIECRYLYGSRQAWHAASLDELRGSLPSWLTENLGTITLDGFLARLGLLWQDCKEICREVGLADEHRKLPITTDAQKRVVESLLRNPQFGALVNSRSRALAALAHSYFHQESLDDDIPKALVDIGWEGRMQDSLVRILEGASPGHSVDLTGYYLGLTARRRDEQRYFCFLPEARPSTGSLALHQNRTMAEIMCSAPHGTTLGYETVNGTVRPVLGRISSFEEQGAAIQREAILAFADHLSIVSLTLKLDAGEIRSHLVARSPDNWARFIRSPDKPEAEAYGAFAHHHEQGDQTSTQSHDIAPRLAPLTLLRVLGAKPSVAGQLTWWIEASVVRSLPRIPATVTLRACAARSLALFVARRLFVR
jgi:FMN phosphatase YigB (HAD superfamily)